MGKTMNKVLGAMLALALMGSTAMAADVDIKVFAGAAGTISDTEKEYSLSLEDYDTENGVDTATVKNVVVTNSVLNPNEIDYTLTNGSCLAPTNTEYNAFVWVDIDDDGEIDIAKDQDLDGDADNNEIELYPIVTAVDEWATVEVNSGAISISSDGAGLKMVTMVETIADANDTYDDGEITNIPVGAKILLVDRNITTDPNAMENQDGGNHIPALDDLGFNINVDSGLANGATIMVTATQNRGHGIGEEASSTTLATLRPQFVARIETPADATIDVDADPSRTEFDAAPLTTDDIVINVGDRNTFDTTADGVDFGDTVARDGTYITIADTAGSTSVSDMELTVTASDQGISTLNIDDSNGAGTAVDDVSYDTGAWSDNLSYDCTDVDGTAADGVVTTVTLTVDGSVALETRSFAVSLESVPSSNDFTTVNYLSNADAGEWDLNGYQCQLQNASQGAGAGSFIWVSNRSSNEVGMTVTLQHATDQAGTDHVTSSLSVSDDTSTTDALVAIPANTTKMLSVTDLFTAVNDANGTPMNLGNKYYGNMLITVNAPETAVDVWGIQRVGSAWFNCDILDLPSSGDIGDN